MTNPPHTDSGTENVMNQLHIVNIYNLKAAMTEVENDNIYLKKQVKNLKKRLHTLEHILKSENYKPKSRNNSIRAEKNVYTIPTQNIFSVLATDMTENKSTKSEVEWFSGHSHQLSNWYTHDRCTSKCKILIGNNAFPTTEHAYVCKKGEYFNVHHDTLQKY